MYITITKHDLWTVAGKKFEVSSPYSFGDTVDREIFVGTPSLIFVAEISGQYFRIGRTIFRVV